MLLDSRLSNKLAGIELNLLIRFFVTLLPLIRVRKVVGWWSQWAVVEGAISWQCVTANGWGRPHSPHARSLITTLCTDVWYVAAF